MINIIYRYGYWKNDLLENLTNNYLLNIKYFLLNKLEKNNIGYNFKIRDKIKEIDLVLYKRGVI